MTLWTPLNGSADFAASGATFKAGYRADVSSEISLEPATSYVNGWTDYSGNGHNLAQNNFFGNFYQGVYTTGGWDGTLNSVDANSNGNNGHQIFTGFGVAGPVHAFGVAKTPSTGSGCRLASVAASGSADYTTNGEMAITFDTGTPGTLYNWYNSWLATNSVNNATKVLVSSLTNNTSGLDECSVNGGTLANNAITYSSATYDMLGIGVQSSSSSTNGGAWGSSIAEVVLVTGTVTTTLRQIIEGYLAWKWGLQAQLPSGHPYFSAAPTVSSGGTTTNKSLSVTCATTVSLAKGIGKSLAATCATLVVGPTRAFFLAISIIVSSAVSTTLSHVFNKSLSVVCATSVSGSRAIAKLLAASSSSAVSSVRQTAKKLAISSTTTASIVRSVAKKLAINSVSSIALTKLTRKALTVASATSVTVGAIKVRIQLLSVVCATSVGSFRQTGKLLAVNCATSVNSVLKAVAKKLAVNSVTSVTPTRMVGKTLAVASTTSVILSSLKARGVTLVVNCSTSVAMGGKVVGKALGVSVTTAASLTRMIGKRLAVAASSAVSTSRSRAIGIYLAVGVSSSVVIGRLISKSVVVTCLAAVVAGAAKIASSTLTAVSRLTLTGAGRLRELAGAGRLRKLIGAGRNRKLP